MDNCGKDCLLLEGKCGIFGVKRGPLGRKRGVDGRKCPVEECLAVFLREKGRYLSEKCSFWERVA